MNIWVIWLSFAIILMIIEIITPAFLFGLFSLGAFSAAVFAFFCEKCYYWQIGIFIIVSFILTVFVRKIFIKYFINDKKTIKTNIESYIGKRYKLIEKVDNDDGKGAIFINGVRWHVVSDDNSIIPKNELVEVESIDGTKLIVKKVNNE